MGELFQHCQFTLSESIAENDHELFNLSKLICKLGFKITDFQPFVIERGSTTKEAILNLLDLLSKYIVPHVNNEATNKEKTPESNNKSNSLVSQNVPTNTEEKERGSDVDDIHAVFKMGDLQGQENPNCNESLEQNEETVLQENVVEDFSENSSMTSNERDFNHTYVQDGICVCTGLYSDIKVQIYKAEMSTLFGVDAVVSVEEKSFFQKELEESTILERKYSTSKIIVRKEVDSLVPHVLHIVEPSQDLQAVQEGEVDYIRQTVLQCLIEAGRQGFSSLALPSVIAGNSGSKPNQECIQSYVEAVKHFDGYKDKWENPLQEILFIDPDDKVIKLIQACFMEKWKIPWCADSFSDDFEFSDRLLGLQGSSDSESEQSDVHVSSFAELHVSSNDQGQQTPFGYEALPQTSSSSISPSTKGASVDYKQEKKSESVLESTLPEEKKDEDSRRNDSGTDIKPMRVNRVDQVQTSLLQKEFFRTPRRVDRSHGKITCCGQHDLKVFVTKKDITTMKVDAIVNAANRILNHEDGVAKVIARAAGTALDLDCQKYIREGNTVDVTDIFVSRGGFLPAKHVLHAVGPKWEAYEDKGKCLNDLRKTVLRCLVEVARMGKSSIALPSISAAIFKVPKHSCAKCYMMAVKHFDAFNAQMLKSQLKEILFVDIDDDMVNCIREEFNSEWAEPCDEDILKEDFHFAKIHLSSKQPSGNKTATHSHVQGHQNEMGARPRTSGRPRGLSTKTNSSGGGPVVGDYMIGEVSLSISTGHAFDIYSDLVVIVGDPFDQISGLPDFKVKSYIKPCEEMGKLRNAYTFYHVSKPDRKNSRLICMLHVGEKKPEGVTEAFSHFKVAVCRPKGQGKTVKSVTHLVITSQLLYTDGGKKGNKLDVKMIGTFAKSLYDELSSPSKEFSSIKRVTLVTSEEAAPHIIKVLESRNLPKIRPSSHSLLESYERNRHTPTKGDQEMDWTESRGSSYTRGSGTSESYLMDQRGHTGGSHNRERSKSRDHVNTFGSENGSSVDEETTCPICYQNNISLLKLPCCQKIVCTTCRNKTQFCPYCRKPFGVLIGDQPDGRMNVRYLAYESADGYENTKAWKIEYIFSGGLQKSCHPMPGQWYDGVTRKAYLPANDDGFQVLLLLRLAFLRRLTFTIGTSVTMKKDNVITWNDIHHKTSLHGGSYGFPDPGYLIRVRMELSAREVKLQNMTREETDAIARFSENLLYMGHFNDF